MKPEINQLWRFKSTSSTLDYIGRIMNHPNQDESFTMKIVKSIKNPNNDRCVGQISPLLFVKDNRTVFFMSGRICEKCYEPIYWQDIICLEYTCKNCL